MQFNKHIHNSTYIHTRALSLRNLVSGYECERVFPAGVGPGSPSRDAANWVPSRSSLSVETRRRYGWLTMVFPGVRLFRANLVPFGRCGGTQEARSTVAETLVALYRVGTHQIRRRQRAARRSTSQGSAEPLCARIKGANREVSEGKADLCPRSVFFLRGPTRSGERAKFVELFQGCTGLWTAGCWLARRLYQLKAFTTMDLGILIFLVSARCVALRNLGLLIKTD